VTVVVASAIVEMAEAGMAVDEGDEG
jgi:hypothetical protein